MRILLDTNVLIAAFIVHGICAELFEHCARHHTLITSHYILDEFKRKLISQFNYSESEAARAVKITQLKSTVCVPADVPAAACQDPDDLPILGSAIAGECRCLITGDKALLKITRYRNIDIIPPGDFWKYEANHRGKLSP